MLRKITVSLAIVAAAFSAADTARAAGMCGPHSYLAASYPNARGGTFFQCRCYKGYRPITTQVYTWPVGRPAPTNPGCVPIAGQRPAASAKARPVAPSGRAGSYRAEPAREPPPPREPETQPPRPERAPAGELGKTAPTEKPAARPEPPIPREGPVTRLSPKSWSDGFPSEKSPAALQLPKVDFDRLRDAKTRTVEWFRDSAKDKGLEIGFEQIPTGDWVNMIRGKMSRAKELFKGMKESATEYVNGIFTVANDELSCIASASMTCGGGTHKLETKTNKYTDTEKGRWLTWFNEDVEP